MVDVLHQLSALAVAGVQQLMFLLHLIVVLLLYQPVIPVVMVGMDIVMAEDGTKSSGHLKMHRIGAFSLSFFIS